MPTLKQITCSIEWTSSNVPLKEYQTSFADGSVETYIAVPPLPTPFSVHLQSHGFIAPGLAMFVYIDGVYQCNRNRVDLRSPIKASKGSKSEVEFRVRQKERRLTDGTIVGKQWKFEKLNIGKNNGLFAM